RCSDSAIWPTCAIAKARPSISKLLRPNRRCSTRNWRTWRRSPSSSSPTRTCTRRWEAAGCKTPSSSRAALRAEAWAYAMTELRGSSVVAVVDDDQRILESLENLLESAGHTVRLFASAPALLESGSLAEIDCLISDIDLPRINGFELMRLVHESRPE